MDRLRAFLGQRPIVVGNLELYSPTIDQVDEVGEILYHVNLSLATFNKETVFKNLLGVSEGEYEQIEDFDDFEALTSTGKIANHIAKALSFFTRKEMVFNTISKTFMYDNKILINKENYQDVSNVIKKLNGIEEKKVVKNQFKTDKAKQKFKELMEIRKKYGNNNSLELKDVLSILCNADGNGINIFNVGQMTIYQVYEHFERLNVRENHLRVIKVWANGLLKENTKIPEWIVKTKL